MEKLREIKLEELEKYKDFGFNTVGQLLDFINSKLESGEISRESLVLSQRIEDKYFHEGDWGVIKKEGDHFYWFKEHNKRIQDGYFSDEKQFPNVTPEQIKKISDEDLEASKEQYHPIWCPVVYKDDTNLYLDLHY